NDRGTHVFDGDPTPKLTPGTDSASQPQLERQETLPQRAAFTAEYQPRPHEDSATSFPARRIGRRLPLATDVRQEAGARRTVFVQCLAAAVSIINSRGSAGECLRAA